MRTEQAKQRIWGWKDIVIAVLSIAPLILLLQKYHQLPTRIASHFAADGSVNGYMTRGTFAWMMAGMMILIPLLLSVVQVIDPKRENYQRFRTFFGIIRLFVSFIMAVSVTLTVYYNLGYHVHMQIVIVALVGLFFIVMGNFMGQVRFNYFVGVRTPWTLADEEVWRRTHRIAGPVFMVAGVMVIVSAFLPAKFSVWVLGTAIVVAAFIPVVYSYVVFAKRRAR